MMATEQAPPIGKASNGITDMEIAKVGEAIWMRCHGLTPQWDQADQLTWRMAATNAIMSIEEIKRAEQDVSFTAIAAQVYTWCTGGGNPFTFLQEEDRQAWMAVTRCWVSIICAGPGEADVPYLESFAVEYYKRQMNKLKPPVVATEPPILSPLPPTPSAPVLAHVNGSAPESKEPSRRVVASAVTSSFKKMIQLKIADHHAKIASLQRLHDKIGADDDEALFEVFAPLLKGE
jgi:hypothetical protein